MIDYDSFTNAPDFPPGMEWLNTSRELRLKDLRGKVVLLDFWTYCCINCMHIIPDLKKLEKKYPDELVVIGVHSAKFENERETENMRSAVLRYEIKHPIVNDADMVIWGQYGVRAWPTLVLISPVGKIIGTTSGEGVYEIYDELIGRVISHFDRKGKIDRTPFDLKLEQTQEKESILSFPGKVLADEKSGVLFISDSNHNRVLGVSLDNNSILYQIGSGKMGFTDGDFNTVELNHPQGLAYNAKKNILYIADTDNHSIRRADLGKRKIETIAGNGSQRKFFGRFSKPKDTSLNSPWDLVLIGDTLYIAMAGAHQLWQMNLKKNEISSFAGSGTEARADGPLKKAALAQPSGITTDGKRLYFADSETSSIRSADIDPDGEVRTIVGLDLFVFGDRDGKGSEVRLQHPLGIVFKDGLLYVADTYNNKIKVIDPELKTSKTIFGSGRTGSKKYANSDSTFYEPGGITFAGDKLFIADTNNHLIKTADLKKKRIDIIAIKPAAK